MKKALKQATHNMALENMISVLKKIISLRTNLSEELIQPEHSLALLCKMSFAGEQGVKLEEVYDPEVFNGFTDSELATLNLLEDMQKTFNVAFDHQEKQNVKTLNDLAGMLVHKKRSV
jgi:hypothetical protein